MHVGASFTKTCKEGRVTETFDKVRPLYEGEPYVLDVKVRTANVKIRIHASERGVPRGAELLRRRRGRRLARRRQPSGWGTRSSRRRA